MTRTKQTEKNGKNYQLIKALKKQEPNNTEQDIYRN